MRALDSGFLSGEKTLSEESRPANFRLLTSVKPIWGAFGELIGGIGSSVRTLEGCARAVPVIALHPRVWFLNREGTCSFWKCQSRQLPFMVWSSSYLGRVARRCGLLAQRAAGGLLMITFCAAGALAYFPDQSIAWQQPPGAWPAPQSQKQSIVEATETFLYWV